MPTCRSRPGRAPIARAPRSPKAVHRAVRVLRLLPLAALALPFGACKSEAPPPQTSGTRDSAGIRITENRTPVWAAGTGWQISDRPRLDIVSLADDPNQLLDQVRGALRLSSGRIVVANGATNELRMYGPGGRFQFARGGTGDTAATFRQLGGLVYFGADSVAANDWSTHRVTVFGPSGDYARQLTLAELGPTLVPTLSGRFPDGTLLVTTGQRIEPTQPAGLLRNPKLVIRDDAQGAVLDTIGTFSGDEYYVTVRSTPRGRGVLPELLPFGRATEVTSADDQIYVGDSNRFEIRVFSPSGQLRQIIRKPFTPVPITIEDLRNLVEKRVARLPDENARAQRRAELQDMPIPKTMPAFASLAADEAGNLWVEHSVRPGDAVAPWDVFDPQGNLLGSVSIPAAFMPLQIGVDFVLGLLVDDRGVEHVQLYDLTRTVTAADSGTG